MRPLYLLNIFIWYFLQCSSIYIGHIYQCYIILYAFFFVIIYDYFHCPFIKSRPLTNFFNVTNYMILAWAAVVAMTRQKYYLNRTTQYNT